MKDQSFFVQCRSVSIYWIKSPSVPLPKRRPVGFLRHSFSGTVCFLIIPVFVLIAACPRVSLAQTEAELDSLRSAADSLVRTVDSLRLVVDSLRAPVPPPPAAAPPAVRNPWRMGSGLGYTLNRGNSHQTTLISSLDLSRRGEKTRFLNEASMASATVKDGPKTKKASLKSKFELEHSERFFYFTTLDLDHNREAGLDLRLAPGLGAGMVLLNGGKVNLNLNLGVNPITEYRREHPRTTRGHYLGIQELSVRFNSRTRMEQSLTYKPRFDRTEAYLMNFNLSLNNQLTSSFSLKVNLEGKYNSRPPVRILPYDRQDWMFYTAVNYSIW